MKITTEISKTYIKSVPKKYKPIINEIPILLLDEFKKRLLPEERMILDNALISHKRLKLQQHVKEYLKQLFIDSPLIKEYLGECTPEKLVLVTRRSGLRQYEIVMSNNKRVVYPKRITGISIGKEYRW